ncbi:E3 ubiquitin-protein ligase UBR3 [Liparis tanakae]|uniref:E3 ubiquitin-protein ligase UBR3 n=1 Tax=Liparis tanakae TaxID=230148 RepID=A0A4Z2E510_9TELE|nr:E3 ubiquitin-protein ligase UBR3 [Liparis tanakae]
MTWFHLVPTTSLLSVLVHCAHHLISTDQLFHVLAMHMRLYSIDSAYNPWTKLTQVTPIREAE